MVNDDHPPLPEDITLSCSDFLQHCFMRSPEERPSARNLLKHEWVSSGEIQTRSTLTIDQLTGEISKYTTLRENEAAGRHSLQEVW